MSSDCVFSFLSIAWFANVWLTAVHRPCRYVVSRAIIGYYAEERAAGYCSKEASRGEIRALRLTSGTCRKTSQRSFE